MITTELRGRIEGKLAVLDIGEQDMSMRRKSLHRRIDALYPNAPLNDEQVTMLDRLEDQEREISAERRRLHMQIDGLRAQVGLARSRDAQWVTAAA
jgi:hypothetical protein